MSGPKKAARTVGYVVLTVTGLALLVILADEVVDWFLGLGIWILFFPHVFVVSILLAGLTGALVTLPARRSMDRRDWRGLVARVSVGIWFVLSIVFVALSR